MQSPSHHYNAKAPVNALELRRMLEGKKSAPGEDATGNYSLLA